MDLSPDGPKPGPSRARQPILKFVDALSLTETVREKGGRPLYKKHQWG